MKKFLVASLFFALTLLQADLLEIAAGVGASKTSPSGKAEYKGDRFDLKNDTGIKSATSPYLWAYIKHPAPLVPNVRLEYTSFEKSGTSSKAIEFGGQSFTASTNTELNLDQLDIILYYSLPLPLVDIDLGLGAKTTSGDIRMSSGALSQKADLGFTLPIGYARFRLDLPASFGVEADIKYIGYKKSHFSDMRFKADYAVVDSVIKLAIEAGYRVQDITIKDISSVDGEVDITIKAPFLGLVAKF